MKLLKYSKNAIWKIIATSDDRLLVATECGTLQEIEISTLKKNREMRISDGWINGLEITDERICVGTSLGEIITLTLDFQIKSISRIGLWINEVKFVNGIIYAVSAEGFLVCINEKGIVDEKRISDYQLIDILYLDDMLVVADTEGGVSFIDDELNIIKTECFEGFHVTKMDYCRESKKIYFASTNGYIGCMNKEGEDLFKLRISEHRIWGIATDEDKIYAISSGKEVLKYDKNSGSITTKDTTIIPTSCGVVNSYVIIGQENGAVTSFDINAFNGRICYSGGMSKWQMGQAMEVRKDCIVIFYEDRVFEKGELYEEYMRYLWEFRSDVIIKNIYNEHEARRQLFKYTSWNHLPIVMFYGVFISGGRTLIHMFETGTITRICRGMKNIKNVIYGVKANE